jgi:N-acetylglucosaminyldiphosphoundecaprenol N-acetyl-beta-D-mannosaminyltransferase
MTIRRVDVLGVQISAVSMDSAVAAVEQWIATGAREYVCVTGVHGVMESRRDPALREVHNTSGMTTPDGMPLVWAGRLAGAAGMTRVYGPDLMLALLQRAATRGWRSFFYGGAPGVADRLAKTMSTRFPGLEVAGAYSPGYPPEPGADIERINAARPDIVWVGLSTPIQERWMAAHRGSIDAQVLLGVGAAFDIHAGLLAQAPRWMQRSGLEWTFRLAHEPRRLAGRYLRNNPAFVAAVLRRPPRLVD